MIRQRIQWLAVLVLTVLIAGPVMAAHPNDAPSGGAEFDLNSSARLATTDADNDRVHLRFAGEGSAAVGADGVSLELGVLEQRDGDQLLTITPDGDFKRRGRSRVFVGQGSAVVDNGGELTEFGNVRIVVKFRGRGDRLRLIGKVRGKNGPHTADGMRTPPDILNAVFRGQRVEPEPEPEPETESE